MTKRSASYFIDEKTLEEKQVSSERVTEHPTLNRKIFKIKKDNNDQKQKQQRSKQRQQRSVKINIKGFEKQPQKDHTVQPSKSIFGTSSNTSSLFGNSLWKDSAFPPMSSITQDSKKGLFSSLINESSQKNQSTSIFGNTDSSKFASGSLFSNNNKNQNQEEDDGDSADLENQQIDKADPTKSQIVYEYQNQVDIISKITAVKYKKDSGEAIENVEIKIVNDTQKKVHLLTAFLPRTNKSILSSFIFPKKSHLRKITENGESIEISVFSFIKRENKLQKNKIKIKFRSNQLKEAGDFYKHLNIIIEGNEDKVEKLKCQEDNKNQK